MKQRNNKRKRLYIIISILILLAFIAIIALKLFNIIPSKTYTAEDLNIKTIKSSVDFNNNGIDDYTDILNGARKDCLNEPKYDGKYWEGGYPPDNIGVCTDVVWRAFKNAGYSMRDMIDKDIQKRPDDYTYVEERDNNIDFRRVRNLRTFFDKYAQPLTLDLSEIEEWQPGDIVIFRDGKHIGIISDKRLKNGKPLLLHNGGQPVREEYYFTRDKLTKHYRFDASKIDKDVLVKWND